MPRNKLGGNKAKSGASKHAQSRNKSRPLRFANQGEIYAQIIKPHGGDKPHFTVLCSDNIIRHSTTIGKFKKRVWINKEDVVLCELTKLGGSREGDDCQIVHKYTPDEVKLLYKFQAISFVQTSTQLQEEQIQEHDEELDKELLEQHSKYDRDIDASSDSSEENTDSEE